MSFDIFILVDVFFIGSILIISLLTRSLHKLRLICLRLLNKLYAFVIVLLINFIKILIIMFFAHFLNFLIIKLFNFYLLTSLRDDFFRLQLNLLLIELIHLNFQLWITLFNLFLGYQSITFLRWFLTDLIGLFLLLQFLFLHLLYYYLILKVPRMLFTYLRGVRLSIHRNKRRIWHLLANFAPAFTETLLLKLQVVFFGCDKLADATSIGVLFLANWFLSFCLIWLLVILLKMHLILLHRHFINLLLKVLNLNI